MCGYHLPVATLKVMQPMKNLGECINQLCLLAFLFLWDGFGHCLLYNVVNLPP